MKLYRYSLPVRHLGIREGVLLENEGVWSEASPLPGFSTDSIDSVLKKKPSPALSFAKKKLPRCPRSVPIAALLMGKTVDEIWQEVEEIQGKGYTHAKVKVGHLNLDQALPLIKQLQKLFILRIDFNGKWSAEDCFTLLSQTRFSYAEEPTIFSFPFALDESRRKGKKGGITIYKPTMQPTPPKAPFVLSSSFESSIGLSRIASIKGSVEPLGLDTWRYFTEDILEEPLYVKEGRLYFPEKIIPRKDVLTPIE